MYYRVIHPLFFLLAFLAGNIAYGQYHEDDYARLIQRKMGGELEKSVQSGFVDLLTDEYAIEVEFARKWKQAIGQALWYGLQTNKQPGIVLIKEKSSNNKYVLQLGSALQYAGLDQKVKVWIWPDDFKQNTAPRRLNRTRSGPGKTVYWLTTSSNKRHNTSCRYFEESNGRYCQRREGTPCDLCGG